MNAKSPRKPKRPAAKAPARRPAKRSPTLAQRESVTTVTAMGSKQSRLIELLRSPGGGTIEQLTQLTGWQPHTVRGTISSALRKRLKLNVSCVDRVYRIVEAQA